MKEFLKKNYKKIIFFFLLILFLFFYLFLDILMEGLNASVIIYLLERRGITLAALLVVSLCIGYSTKTFQTVTNNKILTPSILGFDSLYIFIQTILFASFGITSFKNSNYLLYFLSLFLMILLSMTLFLSMFKYVDRKIYVILLVGTVISTVFQSFSTFIQNLMDPNEFDSLQSAMTPSFQNINNTYLIVSIVLVLIVYLSTMFEMKKYDVMLLGRDNSINLGINYKLEVIKTIFTSSILVAVTTTLVGPIGFFSIVPITLAPYITKSYKHKNMIFITVLISFLVLLASVYVVERVFYSKIPVSSLLNLLGGSILFIMIIKERKNAKDK